MNALFFKKLDLKTDCQGQIARTGVFFIEGGRGLSTLPQLGSRAATDYWSTHGIKSETVDGRLV